MLARISTVAVSRLSAFFSGSPKTAAVLALGLWLAVVLTIHIVLARLGLQTGVWFLQGFLFGPVFESGDSWNVMRLARDWLQAHPDADGELYREIFFEQKTKFQYAPTSLLPFDALALIGLEPTNSLLNGVNRAALLITALAMGVLAWLLPERLAPGPLDADARRARLLLALAAPAATLLFFPLLYAYIIGQLQVWISALFVVACIGWVIDRRALAGVLIGLVCLLKPQFGLFALWGLLRREWNFTIALCVTGAVGLALSVMIYGFGNHLAYLEVLSYLSSHGEAFWANQSANGLLQRIFENGENRVFDPHGFPPFHPGVYVGTLLVTLTMLSGVFLTRRGDGKLAPAYDFLLAALAFTAASPIAWEHHYGVLMPIFAFLAAGWVYSEARPAYTWQLALIGAAFVLSAAPLGVLGMVSGVLQIAQSCLYFAALVVLAAVWRLTQDSWNLRLPWTVN
ncbi:MAG: glycosyltransferase family 87 protein [Hyphomonas sp.]